MATPVYFQNFNTIKYAVSANSAGKVEYMDIVDYFTLSTMREDIYAEDTMYVTYTVKDGETPDQISYSEYGDEQYYWIVLQVNGITDYYNEWPLRQYELDEYILKKYGTDAKANETHHWETVETLDSEGNLMLPGGMTVPEDFQFLYPAAPGENAEITSFPTAVTNRQYEYDLNEAKGQIQILNPRYVHDYFREVKRNARKAKIQKSEIDISELI